MSKPKEYSLMTKDKLMTYTFASLVILTVITAVLWSTDTTPSGWNLGLTLGINAIIAVGIAVGLDALLYKVAVDSPLNLMSAAVFGLIVTDSYSLGVPVMRTVELFPLEAPQSFIYIALISVVGLVVFKKLVGTSGKKYVNPAAAAKLVVMIPFINTLLVAIDHLKSSALGVPSLSGPIGLLNPVHGNGLAGFGSYIIGCFSNASHATPAATTNNLLQAMFLRQVPRLARWSVNYRSNNCRHRLLFSSTQICKMENYCKLPRYRCYNGIAPSFCLWRFRHHCKTFVRIVHRKFNILGVLYGYGSCNHPLNLYGTGNFRSWSGNIDSAHADLHAILRCLLCSIDHHELNGTKA